MVNEAVSITYGSSLTTRKKEVGRDYGAIDISLLARLVMGCRYSLGFRRFPLAKENG